MRQRWWKSIQIHSVLGVISLRLFICGKIKVVFISLGLFIQNQTVSLPPHNNSVSSALLLPVYSSYSPQSAGVRNRMQKTGIGWKIDGEREGREVTMWGRAREWGADRETDAAGSLRWGDAVMIRSQIPLSLPLIPPAHKKKKRNWKLTWEERKACSCEWPCCQSSPGLRRSGLPESAIAETYSPFSTPPETGEKLVLDRFCAVGTVDVS